MGRNLSQDPPSHTAWQGLSAKFPMPLHLRTEQDIHAEESSQLHINTLISKRDSYDDILASLKTKP